LLFQTRSSAKPMPSFGSRTDAASSSAGNAPLASLWTPLKQAWWQRLTFRVILLVLLASTLPALILGVLAMRSARVAQEREVLERNASVAAWGVDKVESYTQNIVENMRLAIELGNLTAIDPKAARPLLSFFLSFMEDIKELSLLDAGGRERVRVAESTVITDADLANHVGEAKFRVAIAGDTYLGPVRTSEFSEPFITLALPIRNLSEDRVVGVLAAEVNLKRLWDEVLSFRVGRSGYLYLVDGQGKLLAHPDFSLVLAQRSASSSVAVQRFLQGQDDAGPGATYEYTNYQGVPVIGVHARSQRLGWGVVVEQSVAEAFENVRRMKLETTIILINAVIVTAVLAAIWTRNLTRPLADLAQGARVLGAGNFAHRIPVRSQDEISEVADRFNAMADQLHDAFQRLRTLLETSIMMSSSLELTAVLTAALEQMDYLTGKAQSGIGLLPEAGAPLSATQLAVRSLHPDVGSRTITVTPERSPALWRVLSSATPALLEDALTHAGPEEQQLWAPQGVGSVLLLPLVSKGEILGILWMGRAAGGRFEDDSVALAKTITNQVAVAIHNARLYDALRRTSEELESRVEARTRELGEAHEELARKERLALLGQLAGGVGHELRNPLGAIGNAAYYLRMRLGDAEDVKVRKHLGILDGEVRRANKIVSDLLDFSRVKQPKRVSARVSSIVTDVLARQPRPDTIRLELAVPDTLPAIAVDPDQVSQVFLNLVINAIEAMPDGGALTIRSEVLGDTVITSVSDTGNGIPPENLEKIFQPLFTTKTKGIGLGLAVSRRLVEANGGTLTVSSDVGRGATFSVAFRAQRPEDEHV